MKTTWAIAAMAVLASCVDGPATKEVDGSEAEAEAEEIDAAKRPHQSFGEDDLAGRETQGKRILGDFLDGLGDGDLHWSVAGSAVQADGKAVKVSVEGAELHATAPGVVYRGADPRFVHMKFQGSFGGEMRITAVTARTPVPGYRIELRASSNDTWDDPCDGAVAVALHGTYSRTRVHNDTPGRLTFACSDGVAAKCTVWGYVAGSSASDPLWRYHQACTRMANNDICGEGDPHTREGTYIQFRDETRLTSVPPPPAHYEPPTQWPPPPDVFYQEGAWGPQGAVCLSKSRWQSVELDLCSTKLKDPRLDPNGIECDELSIDEMRDRGAILFSSSLFNDLALHRWIFGDDLVATVNGYHYAQSSGRLPIEPLPPAIARHLAIDGIILRALPETLTDDDVRPLHLYTSSRTGDRVVTTAGSVPASYQDLGWQGYVLTDARPNGTIPLYLHQRGQSYVTSILEYIPEYRQVSVVGHALE